MPGKIEAAVLITAGTNCDRETEHALNVAGAKAERVHVNDLISRKSNLRKYRILVIPGGFSFGDDISAGKVFANKFRFRLKGQMEKFHAEGKLILGICNGFQVLAKTGILPNTLTENTQEITLTYNSSGKFEDRWLYLRLNTATPCIFVRDFPEVIQLPIAHGEGRFVPAEGSILDTVERENLFVFQYCNAEGRITNGKHNPNGSVNSIAGICDRTGRIFGLMPHPERYVNRLQHPQWQRLTLGKEGIGLSIFRNAVAYAKANL